MFIAYTDASVKMGISYLAFMIVFEDKSIIRRRIVIEETDINKAEAKAVCELLSFIKQHNLVKGIILFDSDAIKSQLKKVWRNKHKYLPKDIKETLNMLQIRTQVIPRKYNIAHRVCYEDEFFISTPVSEINRSIYYNVPEFSDYFMQLSVLEEFRESYSKPFAAFHVAQMELNKKIWTADLVEDIDGFKVYAIHDKRIKVYRETIVKVIKVNYIDIGNHWRVMRRKKKLKKFRETSHL